MKFVSLFFLCMFYLVTSKELNKIRIGKIAIEDYAYQPGHIEKRKENLKTRVIKGSSELFKDDSKEIINETIADVKFSNTQNKKIKTQEITNEISNSSLSKEDINTSHKENLSRKDLKQNDKKFNSNSSSNSPVSMINTNTYDHPNTFSISATNFYKQQPINENELHFARGIKCNSHVCPFPSFCSGISTCKCGEGHLNFQTEPIKGPYCNYKQKKQLYAFILELVVQHGIGHLYSGRLEVGFCKLFFYLVFHYIICSWTDSKSEQQNFLNYFALFAWLAWSILDAIYFGLNLYKDGNKMPLQSW